MAERSMPVGVREFVESLGSTSPTPAGGAAAAASVAYGISLLVKGGEITFAAAEISDWQDAASMLRTLALRALDAIEADCASFDRVLEAKRQESEVAINTAWSVATESPLGVVGLASVALSTFAPFKTRIKKALALDVDAGVQLILAGLSISLANAHGNLASLREPERFRCQMMLEARTREANASLSRFQMRLSDDLLHRIQA